MTSPLETLLQRFRDPAAEQRYRREQRTGQAKLNRGLMIIGSLMLSLYILVAPFYQDWATIRGMVLATAGMLPLIGFYYWYVGRPGYAGNNWIDTGLFVAMEPIHFAFIAALHRAGITGWPFYAILCYNQMLLLSFASLAFSASVGRFLGWALVTVAYTVGAVALLGYPSNVVVYTAILYAPFALLLVYINWATDDKARLLFEAGLELDAARRKADALLHNVLPQSVAQRLQSGEAVADTFDDVTIVFVDVVGFTRLAQRLDPVEMVRLLNAYFSRADRGCDLCGLEKVKTIGDAYMAVAGAIVPTPRPAKAAVDFARWLIAAAHELGREFGLSFRLHVGINTGPVIGGVISSKRMHYDYWGDAINVAARLEGVAPPDGITVSHSTWLATRDVYRYGPPRLEMLKGIGEVPVYDLEPAEARGYSSSANASIPGGSPGGMATSSSA